MAIAALLRALRSREVELPENVSLGNFYRKPAQRFVNDRADALSKLAMCYRRLGRLSAAIRAFHAAIEAAGKNVASFLYCVLALKVRKTMVSSFLRFPPSYLTFHLTSSRNGIRFV